MQSGCVHAGKSEGCADGLAAVIKRCSQIGTVVGERSQQVGCDLRSLAGPDLIEDGSRDLLIGQMGQFADLDPGSPGCFISVDLYGRLHPDTVSKGARVDSLNYVRRLVEIQSPTSDIDACRKVVAEAAAILTEITGATPELFDEGGRPALIWGSKSPKVLLLCHLDTVWPTDSFQPLWNVDGDVARGPGIFDMKTGFVQAALALKGRTPSDGVSLLVTTDEETGSQTSRALIEQVAKGAKAVFVLEASADGGALKIGRKGTSMWRVSIEGRAAHAGLEPEKGINATVELAHLIQKIARIEKPEIGTTVVPTVAASGTTLNTVPAQAFLDVDSRSLTIDEQERVNKEMHALTATLPGAKVTVEGGINRRPLETAMAQGLFAVAQKIAAEMGFTVDSAIVGGASDGNFTAALGVPTLDGLGAVGHGAHAPDEHIVISQIDTRAELLRRLVDQTLS